MEYQSSIHSQRVRYEVKSRQSYVLTPDQNASGARPSKPNPDDDLDLYGDTELIDKALDRKESCNQKRELASQAKPRKIS